MDTTPEYVAMCTCSQVQKMWEPEHGDYFLSDGKLYTLPDLEVYHVFDDYIWLPRLDQLVEMVNVEFGLICRPDGLWVGRCQGYHFKTPTPEQAILKLVMLVKHWLAWDKVICNRAGEISSCTTCKKSLPHVALDTKWSECRGVEYKVRCVSVASDQGKKALERMWG